MGEWQDGSAAQDARVPSGVVMDMRIVRRWTPEPSKTKPLISNFDSWKMGSEKGRETSKQLYNDQSRELDGRHVC